MAELDRYIVRESRLERQVAYRQKLIDAGYSRDEAAQAVREMWTWADMETRPTVSAQYISFLNKE